MEKPHYAKPTDEAYQQFQRAYDFYNSRLFNGDLPQCLITFHRNPRSLGYFSPGRFSSKDGSKTDEIAMNVSYFAVHPIQETLSTLVHEMVHLWQHHFGSDGKKGYHNKEWAEKMEVVGLTPSKTGLPGGKKTGEMMSHYITPNGPFEEVTKDLLSAFFDLSWYDRYVPVSPSQIRVHLDNLASHGVSPDLSKIPAEEFGKELALVVPGHAKPTDLVRNKKKKKIKEDHEECDDGDDCEKVVFIEDDEVEIVETKKSNRSTYICGSCGLKVWGKPRINIACINCNKKMDEN